MLELHKAGIHGRAGHFVIKDQNVKMNNIVYGIQNLDL